MAIFKSVVSILVAVSDLATVMLANYCKVADLYQSLDHSGIQMCATVLSKWWTLLVVSQLRLASICAVVLGRSKESNLLFWVCNFLHYLQLFREFNCQEQVIGCKGQEAEHQILFPKVSSKKAFPVFTSFYYYSSKQRIPFFFSHHHFLSHFYHFAIWWFIKHGCPNLCLFQIRPRNSSRKIKVDPGNSRQKV